MIPLAEVVLQLQFEQMEATEEKLQYFYGLIDEPSLLIGSDYLEIRSDTGISYPQLRARWSNVLNLFFDVFSVQQINNLSMAYFNKIPLQDLESFRDYLNIAFEMPRTLRDRIEFFRSEFTYRYDFGEIKVWLQPDWDDEIDSYCIQLNLESRHTKSITTKDLPDTLQQMHEGIKDIFRQILSEQYIQQLPQ